MQVVDENGNVADGMEVGSYSGVECGIKVLEMKENFKTIHLLAEALVSLEHL